MNVADFQWMGGGLDALGVQFVELIDVVEDIGQLASEFFELVGGEINPGQSGNSAYLVWIYEFQRCT